MLLNLKNLKEKYNLNIAGVIHIGAHLGQESSIYNELGIKHRLYFEPQPDIFQKLVETVKEGIFVNKALGNETGILEMYIEKDNQGQSSSLLQPVQHLAQYPHIKFTSSLKVDVIKLDDYIQTLHSILKENLNFINMDVQGYELKVLEGSLKTLYNIDYIMTEVNRAEVYKDCAKVWELDDFLAPYGFERIETTWDGVTWGDAFYKKKK